MRSLRLYPSTYILLLNILHCTVTAKDVYVDNTNAAADADSTNSMIGDGSAGSPYQTLVKALTAVTTNIVNDPQNPDAIVGQLTENITLILVKTAKVYTLTTPFILSSTLDVTLELKSAVTPTIDWNANTTTADICAGEIPTVTLTSPGRLSLEGINFEASLLLFQFAYDTWGNKSPPVMVTDSTSLTIDQICYQDMSNAYTDSPVAFFNAQTVTSFTVSNIIMALNYFQPFISFLLCNSGSVTNIILHYGGIASTSTEKVLIIKLTGQIVDSKIQDSTATNLLLADTYASVTGFTLFCDQTTTTCKTNQGGGGYISIASFGECYLSNFYTENIYGSMYFTSMPPLQCNKVMSWKDVYINGYSYTGITQATTHNVQGVPTAQAVSFENVIITDFTGPLSFATVYSTSTQLRFNNITIKDSIVSLVLLASGTVTLDFTSSSFIMDSLSITDSIISTTDTAVICLTIATDGTRNPAIAPFSNIALDNATFFGASLISSVGSVLTTGAWTSSNSPFFLEVVMTEITSLTITDCSFVLKSNLAELISFTNSQLYLKNMRLIRTTMQNYALFSFDAFGTAVISNATLNSNIMISSSILKYPSVYNEEMSKMTMYTDGTTTFIDDTTQDMKITPRHMVFVTGVTSSGNNLTDESIYFKVRHEIAVLTDCTFTSDTLEDTSSYIESTVISYKISASMDATSTQALLDLQTGILQGLFTREDSRVTQFLNHTYVQSYTEVVTEYNMILVTNCTFSDVSLSTGGVLDIAYLFPNSTVRVIDNNISNCSGLDGIWLSIKVPNNDIQISGTIATNITNTAALISVLEDVYSYNTLLADAPTIKIKDSSVSDASTAIFLSIEMDLLDSLTITGGNFTGNALAAHFISLRQGLRSANSMHDLTVELESLVFSDMNLTVEDDLLSINSLIFLETDTGDVGLSKGSISLSTVRFKSCSVTGSARSESFDHFVMIYAPAYDIILENLLLHSCQRIDTYPYVNITSLSVEAASLSFTNNCVPTQAYGADTRLHSIMLIVSDGHVDITSSSFSSNYMDKSVRSDDLICPSGILELEGNIDLTVTNSTVKSNEVCQGLFISTDTVKSLVVSNCTFEENIVGAASGIVDIQTCTNCSFENNIIITSKSLLNFIYWAGTDSSTVTTYTMTFINNTMYIAQYGELLLAQLSGKQTNSMLIIDNLKIEGAYDGSSEAGNVQAVLADGGTITIRNIVFDGNQLTSNFIELYDDQTLNFLWESSQVSNTSPADSFITAELYNTGSTITLQSLTVTNVTFFGSSFLELSLYLKPNTIIIKECSFSGVSTYEGSGSVVHASSSFTSLSIYIMDSAFTGCSGNLGGVLWAQNIGISTVNSTYTNNFASEAGSVFFFSNNSDAIVNESTYVNNSVTISGAGTNIASFDLSGLAIVFNETAIDDQYIVVTSLNNVLLLRNVTTYTLQKMVIVLHFQDSRGNRYCILTTLSITLTLTTSTGDKTYYSLSSCNECFCVLPSTLMPLLTGTPYSELYLTFTMSYVIELGENSFGYYADIFSMSNSFYVQIRDCVRGEIRAENGTRCVYCEAGTYSNNVDDAACLPCPQEALSCLGGNRVSLKPGYWRSSAVGAILECPDDGTCLGGLDSECGKGSLGPMCSQCREEEGWVKQTSGGCGKCSEQTHRNAILALVVSAILIYQSFFVYTTYNANKSYIKDPKKETLGMYLRLFSYASSFSMVFSYVKNDLSPVLSKFSMVSNPYPTVFLSIDCILVQKGLYDVQLLGARMLVFLFWPIIKVLFVSLVLIVLKVVKKIDKISQFVVLTTGCMYLVEQPAIINLLVGFFICTELVPNSRLYYLDSYPNVQCYTDNWNQILYALVIPGLILWTVALPVSFYFGIRRGVESIEAYYMRYGHFMQEFRPKFFYWGLIRMTNTTMLLVILNVVRLASVKYSMLSLYTLIYFTILKNVNPYHIKRAYKLERIMIVVFGVSCLFILTLSETKETSSRLMLLSIAALINVCGMLAVVRAAVNVLIRDIKEKIAEFKAKKKTKKAVTVVELSKKEQKSDTSIDAAKGLLSMVTDFYLTSL